MKLKNREVNIFSMSALDLFASGMGAFILLAVISLPFFSNISKVPAAGPQICPEPVMCPKPLVCEVCPPPAPPGFKKLPDLDFVVVLDISGSMDKVLGGLRAEIGGVAALLDKLADSSFIRVVPFGDNGFDQPVSDQFGLVTTKDLSAVHRVLDKIQIDMGIGSGGNNLDGEAVYPGFAEAMNTHWRSSSKNKVVVIITDDSPHPGDNRRLLDDVEAFVGQAEGNKVSVIFTKDNESRLAFYQTVSKQGKGDLVLYRSGKTSLTSSLILSLLPK